MSKAIKKKRGTILLQFYSVKNFGDDMFVKIFADRFSDYDISLVCNPLHVPQWFPENVHMHQVASWMINVNKKIAKILKGGFFSQKLLMMNADMIKNLRKCVDASAIVTGSLYMDWPEADEKEITSSVDPKVNRNFAISSSYKDADGDFIIGANIGPIYHKTFIQKVEKEIANLNHITLRDWASYQLITDRSNVQYAPDVLFSIANWNIEIDPKYIGKVLISVINLQYLRLSDEQREAYFRLIKQVICWLGPEKCCMVSFCKKEGDDHAVDHIRLMLDAESNAKLSYLGYEDNPYEILSAFKSCEFVISTRFHSMILAAVFGKKMFPISYNCKIENYLLDLKFSGKYAVLNDIESVMLEDVQQNYFSELCYDNSQHIRYVDNQFYALEMYLKSKKRP